ncbi:MAG: hypothetical protein JXB48_02850, partial [Candidatus Latescibacteria bacterium]|nr:hypothetical protein [Candidatus Latescibacterota bacterium]
NSTEATDAAKAALNYPIPANNNDSVWDILKDKLAPRLPSSGTIATTSDCGTPEAECVYQQTNSSSYVTVIDITGSGILYDIMYKAGWAQQGIKITIDNHVSEITYAPDYGYSLKRNLVNNSNLFTLSAQDDVVPKQLDYWFQDSLKIEFRGYGVHCKVIYGVV